MIYNKLNATHAGLQKTNIANPLFMTRRRGGGGGKSLRESKKGFSLTEVLVGVALIGLLSGVVIGTFNHFIDLAWARSVNLLRGKIEKAVQRCMVDNKYDYKKCDGIEAYVSDSNPHPQSRLGAEPIIMRELGIEFDSSKFHVWAQGPEKSDNKSFCFTIRKNLALKRRGIRTCVDFDIKTGDIGNRLVASPLGGHKAWNSVKAYCRGNGVCCPYNHSFEADRTEGRTGGGVGDECKPPPVNKRCKSTHRWESEPGTDANDTKGECVPKP